MKITKRQLAKIIKEEYDAVVSEADEGGPGVHDIQNLPEPEFPEPSGNPKEDALRQIVAQHQAGKVDGKKVDAYSASAIVQVLDAISPEQKENFLTKSVGEMAQIAFKLLDTAHI